MKKGDKVVCIKDIISNEVVDDKIAHDLSEELYKHNIYIRTGNMCCSRLAYILKSGFFRLSFSYKNTIQEIKLFWKVLKKIYNDYKI